MMIRWTEEAVNGLENIKHYLSVIKEDPVAAQNAMEAIIARLPQIEDMPLSGQQVPDYGDPNIRWMLEKDYRMIYQVEAEKEVCYLLSIMYQWQLIPKVKELRAAANDAINAIDEKND